MWNANVGCHFTSQQLANLHERLLDFQVGCGRIRQLLMTGEQNDAERDSTPSATPW